jgi:hypothetical protein
MKNDVQTVWRVQWPTPKMETSHKGGEQSSTQTHMATLRLPFLNSKKKRNGTDNSHHAVKRH